MATINKKILKFLARRIIRKYQPKIISIVGEEETAKTKKMIGCVLASRFSTRSNKNFFDDETNILLAVIGVENVETSMPAGRIVSTANIFIKALKLILTKQKYPEFLILEIKSNQAGGVKSLFKIARPEIGIILGMEKLSGGEQDLKNSKQSAREKNMLIKCLRKNELAILNRDDKAAKNLIEGTRAKIITFGFNEKSGVRATEVINEEEIGNWKLEIGENSRSMREKEGTTNFKINYKNSFIPISLTRRQIYPALVATAIGLNYSLNLVEIAEALSSKHTDI